MIGDLTDDSYQVGDFQVSGLSALQQWAALFISRTRQSGDTRQFFLSAHGLVRNRGLVWCHYPSNQAIAGTPPADVNLTLGYWGQAPVEVEGIGCTIGLPFPAEKVQVYALDGTGARKATVPVESASEGSRFTIGPSFETLWYEVAR